MAGRTIADSEKGIALLLGPRVHHGGEGWVMGHLLEASPQMVGRCVVVAVGVEVVLQSSREIALIYCYWGYITLSLPLSLVV